MRLLTATLVFLLTGALAAGAAAGPPTARPAPQVLLELGMAAPQGDLNDDFAATGRGFGAGAGREAGFRLRVHLSPQLSLATAFHFADFADHTGSDPDLGDHSLKATSYRYTLEARYAVADAGDVLRPFLAASAGLHRNRVAGVDKPLDRTFDESANTFGWGVGAGVAVAELEFSVHWLVNRFGTWRFFGSGIHQDYSWDVLVVRGAWAVPLGF